MWKYHLRPVTWILKNLHSKGICIWEYLFNNRLCHIGTCLKVFGNHIKSMVEWYAWIHKTNFFILLSYDNHVIFVVTASSIGVGELEITPVSAAIARHLGIDLSPEGRAARNRRGIAVIVHGPPMSGTHFIIFESCTTLWYRQVIKWIPLFYWRFSYQIKRSIFIANYWIHPFLCFDGISSNKTVNSTCHQSSAGK